MSRLPAVGQNLLGRCEVLFYSEPMFITSVYRTLEPDHKLKSSRFNYTLQQCTMLAVYCRPSSFLYVQPYRFGGQCDREYNCRHPLYCVLCKSQVIHS